MSLTKDVRSDTFATKHGGSTAGVKHTKLPTTTPLHKLIPAIGGVEPKPLQPGVPITPGRTL